MFKKNKDQLYQAIKPNNLKYNASIIGYMNESQILNLALVLKKYYLMLNPILLNMKMDIDQTNNKTKNKSNKNKKNKENGENKKKQEKTKNNQKLKNQNGDKLEQIEVDVTRLPLMKAKDEIIKTDWKKIDKLPYENAYLQKKLDSGVNFFFQNTQTKQIIFLNRSLVDPKLNYQMGGFDQDNQKNNDNKFGIYSQLFEGEINQLDFASQETLLARQKQILAKIQEKKQEVRKLNEISYEQELIKSAKSKKIAIILCFGGSFSFGIFQNGKCVLHKSDKKYVCRKKAGERQLNRDKQSGSQIKSMGSQIRRDQEKKHIANVYQILTENKEAIQNCDLVFLQAPGLNRLFIINDSQTLSGVKDRLRSVCLTAKKANYTQVEALYTEITKVNFVKPK